MIHSVHVRQNGGNDFETYYDHLCALQDSVPVAAVKAHLSQGVLDINADRIRANDWQPILNTLRINKSLDFVAVRSYFQPFGDENEKRAAIQKRKTPAIRSKEITYRLCKSLHDCLLVSSSLRCLELQGIPLRDRDLGILVKDLTKNISLNHLSLEYCRLGDSGLEVVCKGVRNATNISSVNFTGCSLTWRGAECLAQVIKHQAMKRHSEAWRDSLRYRRPDLDRMSGLRRIIINNNPMLDDQGACILAEALKDDLWLKALDLQACGISTKGAQTLNEVLKYNTTLVVLDLRKNPMIDRNVLHSILEQLMVNSNGQDTEYKWIKAEEPVDPGKMRARKRTRVLNHSVAKKATIRISHGSGRRRMKVAGTPTNTVAVTPGYPWRTAARANRYRGFPPDHIPGMLNLDELSENDSTFPTAPTLTHPSVIINPDESTLNETETFPDLKMLDLSGLSIDEAQLKELMLSIENKRLSAANARLNQLVLLSSEDPKMLASIEASFKQFHTFLDMLEEAGLGQLITMAGLDQSQIPFSTLCNGPASDVMSEGPQIASRQNNGMMMFDSHSIARHINNFSGVSEKSFANGLGSRIGNRAAAGTEGIFSSPVVAGSIYGSGVGSKGAGGGDTRYPGTSMSFGSFEEESPLVFASGVTDSNIRPSNRNVKDPTMKYVDLEETAELGGKKPDDLYERLLRDTSGVFSHTGPGFEAPHPSPIKPTNISMFDDVKEGVTDGSEQQVNMSKDGVETRLGQTDGKMVDRTEANEGQAVKTSKAVESRRQAEINVGDHSDPNTTHERGSPDQRASRMSDFNYSMDSFDQSYVSERGEVIHLGDEFDLQGSSASPPPQIVLSEEDI
ncbi:centrosomal protein of 78 kDa-like [Gigantopelta aegis]|uniref:centrosomal protein of 78 kDa-like n=1 Tax=Gigantopelta aegis TaxID=1735272 RepID=UPI001B88D5C7|nr:centrosomal protein of 78 kDa-like [Gigantopelta aegis]